MIDMGLIITFPCKTLLDASRSWTTNWRKNLCHLKCDIFGRFMPRHVFHLSETLNRLRFLTLPESLTATGNYICFITLLMQVLQECLNQHLQMSLSMPSFVSY